MNFLISIKINFIKLLYFELILISVTKSFLESDLIFVYFEVLTAVSYLNYLKLIILIHFLMYLYFTK